MSARYYLCTITAVLESKPKQSHGFRLKVVLLSQNLPSFWIVLTGVGGGVGGGGVLDPCLGIGVPREGGWGVETLTLCRTTPSV